MVSNASEDLPEPEMPVKTIRRSRGSSRSTFWRLCSRAPRMTIVSAISSSGYPPGALIERTFGGSSDQAAQARDAVRPGRRAGVGVAREPAIVDGLEQPNAAGWRATADDELVRVGDHRVARLRRWLRFTRSEVPVDQRLEPERSHCDDVAGTGDYSQLRDRGVRRSGAAGLAHTRAHHDDEDDRSRRDTERPPAGCRL